MATMTNTTTTKTTVTPSTIPCLPGCTCRGSDDTPAGADRRTGPRAVPTFPEADVPADAHDAHTPAQECDVCGQTISGPLHEAGSLEEALHRLALVLVRGQTNAAHRAVLSNLWSRHPVLADALENVTRSLPR